MRGLRGARTARNDAPNERPRFLLRLRTVAVFVRAAASMWAFEHLRAYATLRHPHPLTGTSRHRRFSRHPSLLQPYLRRILRTGPELPNRHDSPAQLVALRIEKRSLQVATCFPSLFRRDRVLEDTGPVSDRSGANPASRCRTAVVAGVCATAAASQIGSTSTRSAHGRLPTRRIVLSVAAPNRLRAGFGIRMVIAHPTVQLAAARAGPGAFPVRRRRIPRRRNRLSAGARPLPVLADERSTLERTARSIIECSLPVLRPPSQPRTPACNCAPSGTAMGGPPAREAWLQAYRPPRSLRVIEHVCGIAIRPSLSTSRASVECVPSHRQLPMLARSLRKRGAWWSRSFCSSARLGVIRRAGI